MDGEWRDRFFRFPSRASPFAGGACAASFGRSCELRRPFPLAGTAAYTTSLAGGELQFDRMSAFK